MGVYIPPGGGDRAKMSNTSSSFFPKYPRPTVGLKIWRPFVPASDRYPALYLLCGVQALTGLTMWYSARRLRFFQGFRFRAMKWFNVIAGGYLLFNSGLEVARLTLPYDPWHEEAKIARRNALKSGEKVSWWFGPLDYKPMPFTEWSKRVDNWIEVADNGASMSIKTIPLQDGKSNITIQIAHNNLASQLGSTDEIHNIYLNVKRSNRDRLSELSTTLVATTEHNKFERSSIVLNPEFTKAHLQLGNNTLTTDDDLDHVWTSFEPWEELRDETNCSVRLIPRWRWLSETDEEESLELGHITEKDNE